MPSQTTDTIDRFARLAQGYQNPDTASAEELKRATWEAEWPPFLVGKPPKGKKDEPPGEPPVTGLNEGYWITRFASDNHIIFDTLTKSFFWFAGRIWRKKTHPEILEFLAKYIREAVAEEQCAYARQREDEGDEDEDEGEEDGCIWMRVGREILAKLLTKRALEQIVSRLQGHAPILREDAFANRPHGTIYTRNGRLEITRDGEIDFEGTLEGRPEDMQTNILDIDYTPGAEAPSLTTWLRRIFCDREDDVQAVAKVLGVGLWGSCRWKKCVVVYGGANRGKSQIPMLAERLVGRERVAEFETSRLGERFELRRFIGKTILRAEDVDPDFMSRGYSDRIKGLTGLGALRAEGKGTDAEYQLRGDKLITMTSNFELRVLPGADKSAWEERLVYLFADGRSYEGNEQDGYFLDNLFQNEASGVLNFALQGISDILKAGAWERSEEQLCRVRTIMENSDTIRRWAEERVTVTEASDGVTTTEAWADYHGWCVRQGLQLWSEHDFRRLVDDTMQALHGKTKSNDIQRGESIQRGWHGIRLGEGRRHNP